MNNQLNRAIALNDPAMVQDMAYNYPVSLSPSQEEPPISRALRVRKTLSNPLALAQNTQIINLLVTMGADHMTVNTITGMTAHAEATLLDPAKYNMKSVFQIFEHPHSNWRGIPHTIPYTTLRRKYTPY